MARGSERRVRVGRVGYSTSKRVGYRRTRAMAVRALPATVGFSRAMLDAID